jgi:hypothetical protein
MKLTTHLHLVPRARIHEAIPLLPNMPSWHGARLKKAQGQLYLYYEVAYVYRSMREYPKVSGLAAWSENCH